MVALVALGIGKDAVAEYSHPSSSKTFTQPQLLACLVLKSSTRPTTASAGVIWAYAPSSLRRSAGDKQPADRLLPARDVARTQFVHYLSERIRQAMVLYRCFRLTSKRDISNCCKG